MLLDVREDAVGDGGGRVRMDDHACWLDATDDEVGDEAREEEKGAGVEWEGHIVEREAWEEEGGREEEEDGRIKIIARWSQVYRACAAFGFQEF